MVRLLGLVLGLAGDDLDTLRIDLNGIVLQFKVNILDYEGPDFVAKAISVEVALQTKHTVSSFVIPLRPHPPFIIRALDIPRILRRTLKLILAFTFSPSTAAIFSSKCCIMRIANWGSRRRLLIRSSRVSASEFPIL